MTDESGAGDRAPSGRPREPADASGPADPGGAGHVIGLGVDLCEVDRMRTVLGRTPGFADRTFTAAEQQYCRRARDPAERFAARFAAKEAVLKALGAGLGACRFTDIEVARADSGAPSLRLHGAAATLASERGVGGWRISLTHTKTMAEAVVIALGPDAARGD
ncbi:MAG TPA: holo-ACP synthase [Acidimicrobiales bacterium]|nr:holo-ACP synthase [Acidimicrobiales bacterium]